MDYVFKFVAWIFSVVREIIQNAFAGIVIIFSAIALILIAALAWLLMVKSDRDILFSRIRDTFDPSYWRG